MSLKSKIESLLFIATSPLSVRRIKELTGSKKDAVKKELTDLMSDYNNQSDKGISIQKIGLKYQMVTSTDNSEMIEGFLKEEITGELTQASLETLTVIAYRGPITKTELEMIRGVNCSVILRNLMIRGLIEEKYNKKQMINTYQVTFKFIKHLGILESSELPDYEKLNSDEALGELLNPDNEDSEKEPGKEPEKSNEEQGA